MALGGADANGVSDGDGVGELVRFFFLLDGLPEISGVGLGDDFFFFTDADGLEDGVGLAAAFFFGDGELSGGAVGFGVGDFSAVDFFFLCFRGAGVGVGAKIFFTLSPNDSSAGARTAARPIAAITKNAKAILIVRCIGAAAEPLFLRQLRQHGFIQANAAFQILEREIFVRRMRTAIGQGQSHQQSLDPEDVAELRDDRDTAAFANERGIFAERYA